MVCCEAVRSAILATAWLLVISGNTPTETRIPVGLCARIIVLLLLLLLNEDYYSSIISKDCQPGH